MGVSDAAVATVDAGGLVTGVAAGMATSRRVRVRHQAVVTVMQSGASVEVSPSDRFGQYAQLTAEAFDENVRRERLCGGGSGVLVGVQ